MSHALVCLSSCLFLLSQLPMMLCVAPSPLTLLQHKYCKYDCTLTVLLTTACCVHSNVDGLGNIH